jgi:hypothetical protein
MKQRKRETKKERPAMNLARLLAVFITLAALSAGCGAVTAADPYAPPEATAQANLPIPEEEETETPAPTGPFIQGTLSAKFTYEKMPGSGSNQFALWVEDAEGNYVRTFFSTRFTSTGGWTYRENALPSWIQRFKPETRTDSEVDAITIQTPQSGAQSFSLPFVGEYGYPLPVGEYKIVLEATLRQEDQVVYEAVMNIGESVVTVEPEAQYKGSGTDDRGMIGDVVFTFTPD